MGAMLKQFLIAAFFATTALYGANAEEATDKGEESCTSSHMQKVEKQIAEIESVETRTKADMFLSMSKVAKENDDTRGCLYHLEAVRKVMGF